jgi:chorismate mutase
MSIETKPLVNIFKRNEERILPYVIAGPCSAESEEQVLKTCTQLFRTGKVDALRAGIWKPRTRPNSFEGVGAKGLPWMKKVKELTGMPVCVEVAKASHVQLCLEFDIDILWIGARTSVNPFAVQEIAEVLRGVDIPVLIKNPINPDLSLWLGAMERIENVGVQQVGAIHRGFSNFGEKIYRNRPQWQIPIEFKRRRPEIPMICDPSHICGNRHMLQDVAQKALDLDYDGLMIESHITPDEAWSDAKQQITPQIFEQLIKDLILREDFEDVIPVQSELERMRQDIDHIDEDILHLLANRMKVAREIGQYKKENNMTILQQKRWNDILEKSKEKAEKVHLTEEFIFKFLNAVHIESINQQEDILNEH